MFIREVGVHSDIFVELSLFIYSHYFVTLFFPRTIAAWNGLSTEVVFSETVDGFKSKI